MADPQVQEAEARLTWWQRNHAWVKATGFLVAVIALGILAAWIYGGRHG